MPEVDFILLIDLSPFCHWQCPNNSPQKRGNFDVVGVGTRSDLGNAQIKCIYMLASSSVSQNISIPWEKAGSKWDWQWRLSKLPQATFARLPFLCHPVSKSPGKFWMKYPSLPSLQVTFPLKYPRFWASHASRNLLLNGKNVAQTTSPNTDRVGLWH